MRANVIVIVAPGLDNFACFVQADEHMFVEAFIAQPAVKGFDESVLHRFAGLDVVPSDPIDGPAQRRATSQFRAVVHQEGVMAGD